MARMNLGLGMRVARLFWGPKAATNQILSTKNFLSAYTLSAPKFSTLNSRNFLLFALEQLIFWGFSSLI
ncbi:hypothetical protein L596_020880 [Steinernema carpocapsae]|uniref:Uncharacterized protein n=1 Tax=Steinernema carpocapsae TaxID=34508 RepID=A0A4U5MVG8_STECR|nr:hypothetical protein L596_020880 [Steinernema carpocapsae]